MIQSVFFKQLSESETFIDMVEEIEENMRYKQNKKNLSKKYNF